MNEEKIIQSYYDRSKISYLVPIAGLCGYYIDFMNRIVSFKRKASGHVLKSKFVYNGKNLTELVKLDKKNYVLQKLVIDTLGKTEYQKRLKMAVTDGAPIEKTYKRPVPVDTRYYFDPCNSEHLAAISDFPGYYVSHINDIISFRKTNQGQIIKPLLYKNGAYVQKVVQLIGIDDKWKRRKLEKLLIETLGTVEYNKRQAARELEHNKKDNWQNMTDDKKWEYINRVNSELDNLGDLW